MRDLARPTNQGLWSRVHHPATVHGGLALYVTGALLPWATVGGQPRDGAETANLFLSLSSELVGDGLGYVGLLWYGAAFGALTIWFLLAVRAHETRSMLTVVRGVCVVTWAIAIMFVGLATLRTPLHQSWWGPLVAGVGLAALSVLPLAGERTTRA